MSDAATLRQLYAEFELGDEMQELRDRTHKTLLLRVDDQLNAYRKLLVDMEDTTTAEYRLVHFRARVLSELFAQIGDVIQMGNQAEQQIIQIEAEQGEAR